MTQPHVLLQLYHSVMDDIRFHQEQMNRLEQRAYNIQEEITNALRREREPLPFSLRPRSSSSTRTPPRRRHPTSTSTTTSTTPAYSPTTPSLSSPTTSAFSRREEPLIRGSEPASAASPLSDTNLFNYIGTYDVPLTTSFARSLLNRSALSPNLTAADASATTATTDPGSLLLYFMLDNLHNESIRDEQHGITDTAMYLTDLKYGDVEHPPNTCCPIQMDVFNENTEVSQINKCKHLFCRQEIRRWLETHHTCPLCRTPIDE